MTPSSDDEGDQQIDDKKLSTVDEANLISMVSAWFNVVNLILNKDKPSSDNKQPYLHMQETIKTTLKKTFKYYGSDKLSVSPFANKCQNLEYIAQVLTGLIWLSKGDIIGCEPLAQKMGGFPGDAKSL